MAFAPGHASSCTEAYGWFSLAATVFGRRPIRTLTWPCLVLHDLFSVGSVLSSFSTKTLSCAIPLKKKKRKKERKKPIFADLFRPGGGGGFVRTPRTPYSYAPGSTVFGTMDCYTSLENVAFIHLLLHSSKTTCPTALCPFESAMPHPTPSQSLQEFHKVLTWGQYCSSSLLMTYPVQFHQEPVCMQTTPSSMKSAHHRQRYPCKEV